MPNHLLNGGDRESRKSGLFICCGLALHFSISGSAQVRVVSHQASGKAFVLCHLLNEDCLDLSPLGSLSSIKFGGDMNSFNVITQR